MRALFLRILVLCGLLAVAASAWAGQSVTVVGRAEIAGGNVDAARNNALAAAFREAVEKGIGVWVQSQTEVKDSALVRDQILTHSQGYVTDHEVIKEKVEGSTLSLTVKAEVAVDKIGADIRSMVGRLSTQMGNPSITFVLTTWEKRGLKGSASSTDTTDVSVRSTAKMKYDTAEEDDASENGKAAVAGKGNYQEGPDGISLSGSAEASASEHAARRAKGRHEATADSDTGVKVAKARSYFEINEELYKKIPDMTIITSFQREFLDKNFNVMAADKARSIAVAESLAQTSVNPNDRQAVREMAAKQGANFVARGEVTILGIGVSEATGNQEVKTKIDVEIIDVNSDDVVGSYTNTTKASSSEVGEARTQAIMKNAVQAARKLASQTVDVWQKRALNGRLYTVEVRKIKSQRGQQRPIVLALKDIAQIVSQTNPDPGVLLVKLNYKGNKEDLENALLDSLGNKPGFSASEFDGPVYENGSMVFTFK
ncbi:flagellar assembly protein T N-terminal domain-containing protein [Geomonas sp. Red32]|uniref:flagellar assembly protein T N-terminal domain-containing protein n=1 Tax=Geomonas sp. Red32 TaxID=2912856 RepID=UPI00202CDF81|nr:flagellar assembly protein T N-terminal domain-containing protein [Geomonas sp. Red32]MCM0080474.1 flagellar assembly protein T N-terminal domain-containing protein [Geomonas sp. Red32]